MRKLYKILYILSFALIMFIYIYKGYANNGYTYDIFTIIAFLTFIFGAIFILKNTRTRVLKRELIFQVSYIIFLIMMCAFACYYDKNALIDNIVYNYYYKIILIPYIGLNIYTYLLFYKRKE